MTMQRSVAALLASAILLIGIVVGCAGLGSGARG